MEAVKYVALALFGVAAALGVRALLDAGGDRWSRAVEAYGKWVAEELDKALIEVSPARAALWITLAVLAGAGLGVLAGSTLGQRLFWAVVLGTAASSYHLRHSTHCHTHYLEHIDDQADEKRCG